jgi:benzoyl-CoA reductase/2-hydroxyglutaryl-CoA dehydratase subunit BcrC/BadD/HgdB
VYQALKRFNVPVLEIEADYGKQDIGQLQTRIEAFIEQISYHPMWFLLVE